MRSRVLVSRYERRLRVKGLGSLGGGKGWNQPSELWSGVVFLNRAHDAKQDQPARTA